MKKLLIILLFLTTIINAQFLELMQEEAIIDSQFNLNVNVGYGYIHANYISDMSPQGNSFLNNNSSYIGIGTGCKAYYIYDSTYLANNAIDSFNVDLSGNGLNGISSGNLRWDNDSRFGNKKSLYFDGNSYIKLPSMNITSSFSAEIWFKIDELATNTQTTLLSQHSDGTHNFFIYVNATGVITFKSIGTNINYITPTTKTYNDGKWHYAAMVFTAGSSVAGYIDGELVYSKTVTGTTITNSGNMFIGRLQDGDTYNKFCGWIGEIKFSSRALTAQEIKNHFYESTEVFTNWGNVGNHSISQNADYYNGTYAGRIISSGVGNSSNYVSLKIGNPLTTGKKFMVLVNAKCLSSNNDTLVIKLNSNLKKIALTTSYARTIYHVNGNDADSIKFYLTKADTALVDLIQIKHKYDFAVVMWNKIASISSTQRISGSTRGDFYYTTTDITDVLYDEFGTSVSTSKSITHSLGTWNLSASSVDWTGNHTVYYNDLSASTTTHQVLGDMTIAYNGGVNYKIFGENPQYFRGYSGTIAFIRFDDITQSNFNPTVLYNNKTTNKIENIRGGGADIVALYDWKGEHYNYNKSSAFNGVNGSNILTMVTLTIANRSYVGLKYK